MQSLLSGLRDFLNNVLYRLGLTRKDATIILLGLDNAGKTTLLYKLKRGSIKPFTPTQRANIEELTVGSLKIKAWDLGGHKQVRHLWRQYLDTADAVVFIIDSADTERVGEAGNELRGVLDAEELANVPIAVLANKIDLESALPRERLITALGIENQILNRRNVQLFPCSLFRGVGYENALQWIGDCI
eukprot:comp21286_c0_seq1/m.45603 comp21286_c0_seq1/g.45603  ORF comp21286_c0_seq1/g.45603 comp21286_c0_seq1/m.45603 type:complete len:188 (-) comp21286_c0_seq1:64-627(-)